MSVRGVIETLEGPGWKADVHGVGSLQRHFLNITLHVFQERGLVGTHGVGGKTQSPLPQGPVGE